MTKKYIRENPILGREMSKRFDSTAQDYFKEILRINLDDVREDFRSCKGDVYKKYPKRLKRQKKMTEVEAKIEGQLIIS